MWTKLLVIVLSYLTGKISLPHQSSPIFEIGLYKIRKASLALTLGIMSLIVFGLSLTLILADFFYMSTAERTIGLSEVSIVGGILFALSVTTFAVGFSKKAWGMQPTQPAETPPQMHSAVNPLVDAVSALIYDFIEERRSDRQARTSRQSAPGPNPQNHHFDDGSQKKSPNEPRQSPPVGMA
ncbi:MAG: hypothetical protein ACK5P7_00220 [Bdellovibrio sp.]|jgi:hypothetical protein